jgi:ABC-2 type transport system permease protein
MVATEMAVFINTPAFIFSGYTFPLWGMPKFHAAFAQIMPFTHFLTAFIKVYQMGASIDHIGGELLRLSMFVILSLVVSLVWLGRQGAKWRAGL